MQVVVAVHDETVVRLVAEVGRSVYVVHLHTPFLSVEVGTVYLSWVGDEDDEALVSAGKAREGVVDMGIPCEFVLGIFRLCVDAVERVDDEDAHPTACHRPMGYGEDIVEGVGSRIFPIFLRSSLKLHYSVVAVAGEDVADVL